MNEFQQMAADRAEQLNLTAYAIAKRTGGALDESSIRRFLKGKLDLTSSRLFLLLTALEIAYCNDDERLWKLLPQRNKKGPGND